jgi:hypothetical protein
MLNPTIQPTEDAQGPSSDTGHVRPDRSRIYVSSERRQP